MLSGLYYDGRFAFIDFFKGLIELKEFEITAREEKFIFFGVYDTKKLATKKNMC